MASVNPFTPVTPPPESQSFPKPPVPRPFQNALKRKASTQEPLNATLPPPPPPPTSQPQGPPPSMGPPTETAATAATVAGANLDPKYLAMVSRIAAYYQQRCQAVANYQQQRCQAWANMHRQRCQDMMQASMLVVAWYVRDRIQRRRRREKRRFKSGLRRRTGQPKITRTEVVRRWVKQIPEVTDSPNTPVKDQPVDRAEIEFSMDKDPQLDKDAKLFEMADNLIKSQYKKIEVPIMGVLNFEESDNDSESDPDEPEQPDEMEEDEDPEEDDQEYYEVDDDELYDDDMEYDGDDGSEVVHHGTGTGSGSRGNDQSVSS
ncbi:Fc.00g061700.m01.CDS01 [Cosmosporella sp. VM-42]